MKNLQKDDTIITPRGLSGQYNEAGFSLIEVMVAAAILGALSYFGLQLTEQMRANQKATEKRFEAFSLSSEVQTLLASSGNCLETFKDIPIKSLADWEKESEANTSISSLKKKFYLANNPEPIIREKFKVSPIDEPIYYSGLRVDSYLLEKDPEDYISEDSLEASLTLKIRLFHSGDQLIQKRLPLTFKFDPVEPSKLTSCHSSGSGASGGGGATEIIDPIKETSAANKTGNEACKELGKTCAFVSSINYASNLYGEQGALSNLCLIGYNQGLPGIDNGNPKSNIHSCEAKIGRFQTYQISEKDYGLTCQGIFLAHCQ